MEVRLVEEIVSSVWKHTAAGNAADEVQRTSLKISTAALYTIHDNKALKEIEEKAFILNTIHYDQNDSYLSVIRYEALFAAYILTEKIKYNQLDTIICIHNLSELPETIELFNDHLDRPVNIGNGHIFPYGIALFNKWCGFERVIINTTITKNEANFVSETIYDYVDKDSYKYYDILTELEKRLFYFISVTKHSPSLNIDEMISMLNENNKQLFRKLPDNNIELGYHINKAISERCLDEFDKDSGLYKLFRSGSRFSKTQLLRSCVNTGYVADAQNIVCSEPIKSSLLEGLSEKAFFLSSPGARKGRWLFKNLSNSGELLPSNVEDNPEPSAPRC